MDLENGKLEYMWIILKSRNIFVLLLMKEWGSLFSIINNVRVYSGGFFERLSWIYI